MKKNLLLLLLILSVNLAFSQFPCVTDYKINNGGGSCPDLGGVPATGTVTLKFDGPLGSIIPAIALVQYDSASAWWDVTGITFGAGTLNNNGSVTYCYYLGPNNNNNLLGGNTQYRFFLSYFPGVIGCGDQATLPVSFRSFTAVRSNSVIALKWTTSTEVNNTGFEIQRLIGNGSWQAVSFVATQAVDGNSSTDLTYAYTDVNSAKGISQYRIRQIDIDGRSKLSEIRAVRGQGQKNKIIIYPNPSSDGKISILFDDLNGIRDVSVSDMSGRMIKQMKGVTNNNIQIDNLNAGFYTVRILNTETGEQAVEKFVVNKR